MEEFRLDDSSQFNLIRNNGLMENNEHVVWFYNEFLSLSRINFYLSLTCLLF